MSDAPPFWIRVATALMATRGTADAGANVATGFLFAAEVMLAAPEWFAALARDATSDPSWPRTPLAVEDFVRQVPVAAEVTP